MIEALFYLALIFFVVSGVLCIGAFIEPYLTRGLPPMATRDKKDRDQEGNNTP